MTSNIGQQGARSSSTAVLATPGVVELLRRLWHKFSRRRRAQIGLLLALMLVSAFSEVMSLGAVLPFIGALTAPDELLKNHWVAGLAAFLGLGSGAELIWPLTLGFIAIALIAAALRLAVMWIGYRFAAALGTELAVEAYRRTLYQPDPAHLEHNSSTLISAMTGYLRSSVAGLEVAFATADHEVRRERRS